MSTLSPSPPSESAPVEVTPPLLAAYVEDLIAGRREACRATAFGLLEAGLSLRDLYLRLIRDSLYEVGRRWEVGAVSVAQEHLATAESEALLASVFPKVLEATPTGRTAVVSCATNELHQVGGRIVADTLELQGWSTWFLGAGLRLDRVTDAVERRRPDLLCLSVALHDHLGAAERTVEAVRAVAPALPIVVGGRAFELGGRERLERLPGVRWLATIEELEDLVHGWKA
jgi:methanogenic corrinoid protein MtbC1